MADPLITPENVALASTTYEADYDLAGATLRQCADEIYVVMAAMGTDCNEELIKCVLTGIAQRMEMAARVTEYAEAEAGK